MNYTQATFFAPKDSLSPADPLKVVKGADFDPEFAAVSAAIATKVDTATASGGLAKAATSMALDFTNLATAAAFDLAADVLAFYDTSVTAMKKGTFNDFLGGRTITAGTGLTGGGTLADNRTIALSHLGIQSLTDPNADRIMFWDDSDGKVTWLSLSGLTITTTTLSVNAVNLGTGVTGTLSGSNVSGGTFGAVNGSALTALNGTEVTTGTVAAARIANLDAAKITTGTLVVGRGGTGQTSAVASARAFNLAAVTVASDPGGTPTGTAGDWIAYY